MPGFADAPAALHAAPSHLVCWAPFFVRSEQKMSHDIVDTTRSDNAEHGKPSLTLEADGCHWHGPVTKTKLQLEVQRLTSVCGSISKHGYDLSHGPVKVRLLRRGSELRFVIGPGSHRVAVAAALGIAHVPAAFMVPAIFDVDDVAWWPQVRNGLWTATQARHYIDYLFDFDSRAWARAQGLVQDGSQD